MYQKSIRFVSAETQSVLKQAPKTGKKTIYRLVLTLIHPFVFLSSMSHMSTSTHLVKIIILKKPCYYQLLILPKIAKIRAQMSHQCQFK